MGAWKKHGIDLPIKYQLLSKKTYQCANLQLAISILRGWKLWKRYKYCRNPQNKDLYDEAKQTASEKVRLAKRKYEKSIAVNSKEDTKLFWKFVQSKTKVKESIKCIKDSDGEVYSDNRKIAEELNNFFKSVFTKEDDANIPEFDSRTNEELTNIQFSEEIVSKLLEKVKESKSQGTDSIHPKFIKETAKYLAKPVNIIFRKSMEQGKLPDVWKQANVTPIHKYSGSIPRNACVACET